MKQSVNFTAFVDAFHAHQRYDQFGYEALKVIFDYLAEYEDSTGVEIELDVIAICCDYDTAHYTEIASNYSIDLEGLDDDEAKEAVIGHIQDSSSYLGETVDGVLVYNTF